MVLNNEELESLINCLLTARCANTAAASEGREKSEGEAPLRLDSPAVVNTALARLVEFFCEGDSAQTPLPFKKRARLLACLKQLDESWCSHPSYRLLEQRLSFSFFPGVSELNSSNSTPNKSESLEQSHVKFPSNESDVFGGSGSWHMRRLTGENSSPTSRDQRESRPDSGAASFMPKGFRAQSFSKRILGVLKPSGRSSDTLSPTPIQAKSSTVDVVQYRRPRRRRSSSRDGSPPHELVSTNDGDEDIEDDDSMTSRQDGFSSPLPLNTPTNIDVIQARLRTPLPTGHRWECLLLRQRSGVRFMYRLFLQRKWITPDVDKSLGSARHDPSSVLETGTHSPGDGSNDECLMSWRKVNSRTKRTTYGCIWCGALERGWKDRHILAKVRIPSSGIYVLEVKLLNQISSQQTLGSGDLLAMKVAETPDKLLHVSAILPSTQNFTARRISLEGQQSAAASLVSELQTLDSSGCAPSGFVALKSKVPVWSSWQGCHTLSFDGEGRVSEPSRKNIALVQIPEAGERKGQGSDRKLRGVPSLTSPSTKGLYNAVVSRFSHPMPSGSTAKAPQAGKDEILRDEGIFDERRKLPAVLQLGKMRDDRFSLDFTAPLSPLQAFVLAMGAFDA